MILSPLNLKKLIVLLYKVANCGEIADVMTGELSKNYPKMTVESIMIRGSNHIFNVLNRNQSTSIFEPKKWNDDFLVIDAWKGNVYTKRMFLLANSPLNFYGLNRVPLFLKDGFFLYDIQPVKFKKTYCIIVYYSVFNLPLNTTIKAIKI
jgi:hypothetical protein